jgi:ABC-2 type transport system ATP-binding protein
MIAVNGVTKVFGLQKAVNNISFTARPGEILGFLGPNGAGKSTTMKMITSYLKPDEGTIQVCDEDVVTESYKTRSLIGYLPEHNSLYTDMYVREYLGLSASIHKLKDATKKIEEVIQLTGLQKEQNKIIGTLSKGYKQRVGLAQAILHNPQVLILDEPTSGLDMNQLVDIRNLIKNLGKEKTVILSTHIMQEVQALCDRVIIINDGIIVADDTIDQLHHKIKGENLLKLTLQGSTDHTLFTNISGVNKVEQKQNQLWLHTSANVEVRPEVFNLCREKNWVIMEMVQEKLSVEDIFQKLTKS